LLFGRWVYHSFSQLAEREKLAKLSGLALRNRRDGLTKLLPPFGEVLRGSLMERYLTCGSPDCKCARGERHGPVWYLSVTLDQSHRAGCTVPGDQLEQVRRWIENYRRVKENLEKIFRYQPGTDAPPKGQSQEKEEGE
jgi:hypothetical protein